MHYALALFFLVEFLVDYRRNQEPSRRWCFSFVFKSNIVLREGREINVAPSKGLYSPLYILGHGQPTFLQKYK